jgi:sulfatase maturation enzyme AslB (radical SAM superfamily)
MEYNYFLEEKEIIECYLESDLFNKKRSFQFLNDRFSSNSEEFSDNFLLTGIELIVRPQCNQKCEYCYITRYGNNLYPEE